MHASAVTIEQPSARVESSTWRLRTRTWSVALVLWIASNVFATCVANFVGWHEGGHRYQGMADFCKWDCNWYSSIIDIGYSTASNLKGSEANWVFNPLFPLTAYPLHKWFHLSPYDSMVLVGKLELLLAIYAFLLLLDDDSPTTADLYRAGALVAFNPYVVYAHAGYAEPLYFALIAFAFYYAGRHRWISAGLVGGLASATRVVGVVFAASYVLSWFRAEGWRLSWRKLNLNFIIGLLLAPLGTALFMFYLYHHMGDAVALQHGHVAWGRELQNPWLVLRTCLRYPGWSRVWALMMIAAWIASAYLLKLRKLELALYLILALALATLSPMPGYWGVARYVWWQPPFLYAIYRLLRRNEAGWLLYLAFTSAMAAFMIVGWFSGHNFVV